MPCNIPGLGRTSHIALLPETLLIESKIQFKRCKFVFWKFRSVLVFSFALLIISIFIAIKIYYFKIIQR